ncbi:MAG: ABC transporter substrate-binding protein [Bacteroidota bacterium]
MIKSTCKILFGLIAFSAALFLQSCGDSEKGGGTVSSRCVDCVITHELSDPEELTPLNANDNSATIVFQQVFQTLVHIDFKTYQIVPVLATQVPEIIQNPDGSVDVSMEIRPEAKWDNGEPITGHDVAFSLKVLLNPKTDSKALKPYFDKVKDVIIDEANPKKFVIKYAEPYMAIKPSLSDLYIIPSYVYDQDGIMKNFTVKQIHDDSYAADGQKTLKDDPNIQRFAEQYNDVKFKREVIVGSGPYRFHRWVTDQRVIIKLKEDWWGNEVEASSNWFEANPSEVIFESINDLTTAVVAMKGEKLDAMRSIPPGDLVNDLSQSETFMAKFDTFTPPLFAYDYIAINMKLEKFSDVRTRKALAHIMNVQQLIDTYCYGLGEPVASFTHPSLTERLNPNVQPYAYDLDQAEALLAEAGWKDSDGNGLLDMEIDGEVKDFVIELNYNTGNKRRETACLIFSEAARKVGIKVEVISLEWAVLLERNKVHDFEMFVSGWISSPFESDPKQIWHTDSYNDKGSNYTGFGNEESDGIIEELRRELDDAKRYELYKRLHQIIHDDVPYIFLLAQKERIAIANRFGNSYGSGIRPGYWTSGFTISTPTPN